jgi:hypothetical protein
MQARDIRGGHHVVPRLAHDDDPMKGLALAARVTQSFAMRHSRMMACASALFVAFGGELRACSMRNAFGPVWRPRQAFMLGVSTSDTLVAGAGEVKWTMAEGHNGPTGRAVIYGQVVVVDSSRGPGDAGSGRVVLVPWDYGPDCAPTPWGGTAKWRRPGTRGLYKAILRQPQFWAGGLPTYDVFTPEFEPYTSDRGGAGLGPTRDTLPQLTAEQMFAASAHFTFASREDSLMSFLGWAAASPSFTRRPPLNATVWDAAYIVRRLRIRALDVPIKGTYRVVATLTGTDSVTFYARTDSVATDSWDDIPGRPRVAANMDRGEIAPIEGYDIIVSLGASSDIPHFRSAESYVYVPVRPDSQVAGTRVWKGQLQPDMMGIVFPGSPFEKMFGRARGILDATFRVESSGAASFIHRSRLADGRELVISGSRVSSETGR